MSRSHHASDCRSGTIGATVSYTGSVFCSVSMSTNRRVHTPLHLICIQCRTNSLFCISERPLGRGDTSIFSLTRCISTGILSYTASLYNTSTPHRNLYVVITESIVTQQSPHGFFHPLFLSCVQLRHHIAHGCPRTGQTVQALSVHRNQSGRYSQHRF